MTETEQILKVYSRLFGEGKIEIVPLPKSGSDRKYFRIKSGHDSVICTLNPVSEENEAFIGFSRHFVKQGLPVPKILGYDNSENIYFQSDLGNVNLFSFLNGLPEGERFSGTTIELYHRIIDTLILFQTRGIDGLDINLCYPHRSFDRQSMMWDMNYFKYMFLKLLAVPFNEKRLEHDFNTLADFLLQAGDDFFLYRDFQSANIMVFKGDPWFIDYQGGRRGAPQYDIASFLYDAKVPMPEEIRLILYEYYIRQFCVVAGMNENHFREFCNGFAMIRLMQAMGTFGFRGLYENKPTFTESMVPGLHLLLSVAEKAGDHIRLPELFEAIRMASEARRFKELAALI
jgi:aminoglycoside/choline kinase family phosphotransferase